MKIGMKESMHGTEATVIALSEVPDHLKDALTVKKAIGNGKFLCSRPFEFDKGFAYTHANALNLPELIERWTHQYGDDLDNKIEVIEA